MAPYKTSRRRGSLGGQVMSFEGSVNMVLSVGTSAIDLLYYYSLLSFTYLHVLSLCSVQRQQRKQYHYPQSPAHPDGIPHAHIFSQALRRLHRCQRSSIPKRFNRNRSCYSIARRKCLAGRYLQELADSLLTWMDRSCCASDISCLSAKDRRAIKD
jgi:hypothetical protein